MQDVTQVNAGQASKPIMRKPTRRSYGEGCQRSGSERRKHRPSPPGYWRLSCMEEGNGRNTGSPAGGVARANRRPVRARPGRPGWREKLVVPRRPGNAGGGKELQVEGMAKGSRLSGVADAYYPGDEQQCRTSSHA